MQIKLSLKRFIGFLCVIALGIISVISFSQVITVHASTTAKLGIQTADHGNISVSGNNVENRTVGDKYIYYDVESNGDVLIKAIPNEGYHFVKFNLTDKDGKSVEGKLNATTTSQSVEFKMPNWEIKVSAEFAKGELKDEEETTLAKTTTNKEETTTKKEETKKSLDFDTGNLKDYASGDTVDPADIAILTSKGIGLMRAGEQGVSSGAHLSISVKADKTSGGTYNSETMKYEGERTPGVYKYPDIVTYNIVVKNYGDTDLHYVKITDTLSEELKNAVDVNSIKFDLQKGYYITTDSGEQVFVSLDDDSSGTENNTSTVTTNTKTDTASSAYSSGTLTKSLTINEIKAGKTVNLKLTMAARQDIKRAINLKNTVNVTASMIQVPETTPEETTTASKEETTTASKSETTTASTETVATQAAENTSSSEGTTSVGNTGSLAGEPSEVNSKIVALPVDEVMHNDVETISIGKYAVHYPQMSVSMVADKTTSSTTNTGGVIDVGKKSGIYKAGDLAKFTITVKNEGNVALHDVTLSDAVSDALKGVLLAGTDGYYFDKTATITDSQGKSTSVPITVTGQTTAVLSQLESGSTAQFNFLTKIKSDAKEAKQLVNKVSLTAKWANMDDGTTKYEAVESDLTKHVAEDVINVMGTPKMAVSIIANKTTGVTLGTKGKYEGTRVVGKYISGDTIEYKIRVANLGGTTLHNLKITDTKSTDLQKAIKEDTAGFVAEGTISTSSGNEVKLTNVSKDIVTLDKLNVGDSVVLSYKANIKENASMFFGIENSVKLEAQYDDLAQYPATHLVALDSDSDSDKISIPGNPVGTLSLKTDKDSYVPGDKVTYSITVTNTGNCDLKNVLLKGTLDDTFTKLVSDNTFNQAKSLTSKNGKAISLTSKGTNLAQLNSIGVGDSVTIPFTVNLKKDCGNQFRLSVKVVMLPYYSTGDTTLASIDSMAAETSINVIGDGSASVAIKADKTTGKKLNEKTGRYEGAAKEGTYQTGDEVDYTVTVTNTGKADLYNVRLEDILSDKLKEVVDEDAGFVIPETGEVTTKNGKVVTIGTAEVTYNEGYKAKYTNDSILAQEENTTGKDTTETATTENSDETSTEVTTEESSESTTESTEGSTEVTTEESSESTTESTEESSESTTENTTLTGALIVNAAEATTQENSKVDLTTDSDLVNKAFNGTGSTTNLDGNENSNSENSSSNNNSIGSTTTSTSSNEPFSIQMISSGTDSSDSGQVITLAQLPAGDSVQLHFKAKLNSKAVNTKGLENTIKMTASKISANTTLEALKADKAMEDSDKISVESAASLRIAKLADKTKGVTLKDGRYEGTRSVAKYGPNSTVKYKITITNLGSNTATNLLVTEEPSEQLKELSNWGKFSTADSVKTKNGKTAKVTIDGVTAVVDKLASKDSIDLEFDVKLKKNAQDALKINNTVSISGNYVINGQEAVIPTTNEMTDSDSISIDKTVKASGNDTKKKNSKNSNSKNSKADKNSVTSGKSTKSSGTKTGDISPIGLLLAIMTICVMTFVIVLALRKSRK